MDPETAFDRYHRSIFRFLYRFTRRADIAEDLVQECFLAMVRHPGRFDSARGNVRTYLFGVSRNLALKHYRDHEPEAQWDDDVEPPSIAPDLDTAAAVEQAVSGLPPLQREAVLLFEYEGFTLEEIADVVGADVGSVKSRLFRARQRLKQVLGAPRKEIAK